ncbi:protein of unknown function (DUF1822) [Rubidibacter lacunae KORDI 51-2]|uniref:DUF1822 domain-containing protein n=1 Tax=Rubidibacter lacunae KORDI 51-2 TaxID=582515 RepID=U5DJJ9_9CHRO|nr:DUF1822 family protein [Rubidibacter lacunae]ERN39865.1 protein of unknown function (DUF1822) [Rubidibacter lacunae KORDI 51-2]
MNAATAPPPIAIALDRHTRRYAEQFATEQATPQKGKQVYLNTLAVCAVRTYLNCLAIATAPQQGKCWQPGLRAAFDVNDLIVPGRGRIACCPVLPAAATATVPIALADDCLGCAIVRIGDCLDWAYLLGFVSPERIRSDDEVPLAELQSLDDFLSVLERSSRHTRLQEWFAGIFAPEWEPSDILLPATGSTLRTAAPPVEVLAAPDEASHHISRGKVLRWHTGGDEQAIVLVVKAALHADRSTSLCMRLYPCGNAHCLPSGLCATLLDASDEASLQVRAGDADNWLQLDFLCQPDEPFNLELDLDDVRVREIFTA